MPDVSSSGELVVAAGEVPGYLGPATALVVTAAVIGYLTVRARVGPIVGFPVAGILIGPSQLGVIENGGSRTLNLPRMSSSPPVPRDSRHWC